MKLLISALLISTLFSCGKLEHYQDLLNEDGGNEPQPEEIVEAIMPELLEKDNCDILYPQGLGDIVAAISCENEAYILHSDGSFVEGDISNLDLGELPLNDEETEDEEDDNEQQDPISCSSKELLINGSFEEGHALGNNKWGLFSHLPGWYSNTLRRNAAMEIQNGTSIGGLAPSDGTAKLELDAHNKDGYKRSDAIVVQDVVTAAGEMYVLSFDYSARVANNAKTNRARVRWNGKKVAKLNNNTVGWKSYEIVVKSISDIQRIEFVGVHDKDTVGGYIDNVSLKRICTQD